MMTSHPLKKNKADFVVRRGPTCINHPWNVLCFDDLPLWWGLQFAVPRSKSCSFDMTRSWDIPSNVSVEILSSECRGRRLAFHLEASKKQSQLYTCTIFQFFDKHATTILHIVIKLYGFLTLCYTIFWNKIRVNPVKSLVMTVPKRYLNERISRKFHRKVDKCFSTTCFVCFEENLNVVSNCFFFYLSSKHFVPFMYILHLQRCQLWGWHWWN